MTQDPPVRSPKAGIVEWLLDGDPAVRWQVMRDLTDTPASEVESERQRISTEGWGAALLASQDRDGRWAGALYSPKWTSTTYTLLLLHWLGLPPGHDRALAGCRRLWEGARFYGGGLNLAKTVREPETCITGMLVLLASYFLYSDERLEETVAWLLGEQLEDGGWNCESVRRGSRHGSFHTSITVLDSLLAYQREGGGVPVTGAMTEGRRFFLEHSLYRSHRTGEVVDAQFARFPFPPQWHFDVMRGLEHFRAAGAPPDDRLADAIGAVDARRRLDGTWPVFRAHPGRHWFVMEPRGPSRWSTLRAIRVLDWWAAGQ